MYVNSRTQELSQTERTDEAKRADKAKRADEANRYKLSTGLALWRVAVQIWKTTNADQQLRHVKTGEREGKVVRIEETSKSAVSYIR